MELKKSYWVTDGNEMSLSVPFVKVDKERRIVSGFATLDNVDKHGDIVDTSASMDAFTRFRGNIREMHQPIAVGKVVSFKQKDFYDSETKKNYSGVFVDVYVSKGAQDTWEKVLDGTLSGFSIGGSINKTDTVMAHDDHDGPIRIIKDYDLVELSLVDNPANQFANVFSIQKSDIGFKVTGMATTVKTVNVFYCDSDQIATTDASESLKCDVCSNDMKSIGWIEDSVETKSTDIEKTVNNYIAKDITGEGGNDMSDELEVPAADEVEEVVEESTVEEAPVEEAGESELEKSADPEDSEVAEEAAEDSEFEKMLSGIKTYIEETISKAMDTPSVEEIIAELTRQIGMAKSEMTDKHGEMMKAMETMKSEMGAMSARISACESATAVKKSNDQATESFGSLKKSDNNDGFWKGSFLGINDL
jgi:hypothetical protein